MSSHFRIHELLSRDQLDELEAYCREPGTLVDEVVKWMAERGHKISRTAAWNWKREFELRDRTRRAADLSGALVAAASERGGSADLAAASLVRFQQMLFEHLLEAGEADAGDLMRLGQALRAAVSTGAGIEDLRQRQNRALAEAEAEADSGASGATVVARMRQALGLTARPAATNSAA
jgi:hypothetical protein